MKDKQKIMILSALGVVLVGVGAFSFMGGGGTPEPAPVTKKKVEPNAENTSATTSPSSSSATGETPNFPTSKVTPTNPGVQTGEEHPSTSVTPTTTGDPNSSATGSATANATGAPAGGNAVSTLVDPALVAAAKLPVRDPFNGARWDPMLVIQPTVNPVSTPVNTVKPSNKRTPYSGPRLGNRGSIPPFPVGGGDIGPGLSGVAPGGTGVNSAGMPDVREVAYKVNGIVNGANPAVIVTDGSGKQRLVRVGSNLDPDTKVIGIENGQMVVSHLKKIKKISIEDSAKSTPTKGGGQSQQNQ